MSAARAWRPTVGAGLTRTLGSVRPCIRCSCCAPKTPVAVERRTALPRTARRGRFRAQFASSSYRLASWLLGRQRERQEAAMPHRTTALRRRLCGSVSSWAAASSIAALVLAFVGRRLEYVACHGCQRGAGGTCSGPGRVARPWQAHHHHASGATLPNPSVKPSPNGGPPGPGRRYAVHFRQPGPGVPPSVPAYLER